MNAFHKGFARRLLFEKYKEMIWGKSSLGEKSFYQALYKHEKHKLPGAVIVQTVNHVGQDVQGIAKMVTQLMSRKLESMNPEDISFKDYGVVHKVAMDEKKLQLDKNAQMMAFAAIFGLPEVINPLDAVEIENPVKGELVYDEPGSDKNSGDKPENT
jgi:hypothetical protein